MPDHKPEGGRFILNVNFVFAANLTGAGLSFLIAVLLARALGPEGRGVTSLYQGAVNIGYMVVSMGIASAAVYFVARRSMTPRELLEACLSLTVLATIVAALGVLIAYLLFGDALADEGVPYWLAVFAVPAAVQFRGVESVLQGQGRFLALNAVELLLSLSALIALATIELVDGLTIARAVTVWSFAFLPPALLGYILVGTSAWPRCLAGPALLKRTASFGMQGQLSNLVQLLNYRLDSYLVLVLVSASGVGLYTVGVQLSEGLWFIANAIALVLLTNLTAGDEAYAARATPLVCRGTILVSGIVALCAAAASPIAVPLLFGSDFKDATLPFVILLPGSVALAGTKILAAYVFSRGRPLVNGAIAFVSLASAVAADAVLIPLWEVKGAALGASLGYIVSLVLTAIAYRRLSGGSLAEALVPRPSDLSLYLHEGRGLLRRLPLLNRTLTAEVVTGPLGEP